MPPPGSDIMKSMDTEKTPKTAPAKEEPKQFTSNREFILFLYHRIMKKKRWWLLPLLLILMILGYFFNIPGKESILPALYFIF